MDSEKRVQLVQRLDSIQSVKHNAILHLREEPVQALKVEDMIMLVSSGKVVLRSVEELLEAIKDDGEYAVDKKRRIERAKQCSCGSCFREIKREMHQEFVMGGTLTLRDLYDFSDLEETQAQRHVKCDELADALCAKGDRLRDLAKFDEKPDALKLIADFESYNELGE